MRIVRHPNIVQLKAFYYSNGERVSFIQWSQRCGGTAANRPGEGSRKTRCT